MFDFFELIAGLIESASIVFNRFFDGLRFLLDSIVNTNLFLTSSIALLPPFLGTFMSVVLVLLMCITILRLVGDFFL